MKPLNLPTNTISQNLTHSDDGVGPWALILVGLPGSGKSTFVNALLEKHSNTHIASTDNLLEIFAKERGISYTEAFNTNTDNLQTKMLEGMAQAIKEQKDIIVDQTNMSIKSRKNKIDILKKNGYTVLALLFEVDDDSLQERLKTRANDTGKVIPQRVMETMSKSFQVPSMDEGFEIVINVIQ
jgi:predicted kinase